MKANNYSARISWLHISDTHLPPGDEDTYLSDKVLKALVETMRQRGAKLDFIFFTGDLAKKGQDYSKAEKFFDDLLDASGLTQELGSRSKERLFMIPGNHDVDLEKNIYVINSIDSAEESQKFFNPKNRDRTIVFDRHHKFINFYNSYFNGIRKLDNESPHLSDLVSFKIRDNIFNIRILGFISTWFSKGKDDPGKLWMGERLCESAFEKNKRADITIVLQHHPISWLNTHEKNNIKNIITKNADAILLGHTHENDIVQKTNEFGQLLECGAGAIYVEKDKKIVFRALFGYLDLDVGSIIIKAIKYSDRRQEWVWDTDYRIQKYELKNKSLIVDKFRDWTIDIPVMIFSMTKSEAQDLLNGSIFSDDDSGCRNNFLNLKEALKESNISQDFDEKYGLEREDWRPYNVDNETIRDIIINTFDEINNNFEDQKLPKLRAKFIKMISAKQIDKRGTNRKKKKPQMNGIVVIDPISLFHPYLRQELKDINIISCNKTLSIFFSPICNQKAEVNNIIEKLFWEEMPEMISSYNNNLFSLCEIGVGDIRVFRRRLFSAVPYSPSFVRNYILKLNIKFFIKNFNLQGKDIENLWS